MKRVTIARLMVGIAVVSVGIAALKNASAVWAGVLLSLTLGLLGCSAFGVAYRRGPARAGWFGFALFGGGYLALTIGPWVADDLRSVLPTTQALSYLQTRWYPGELVVIETINSSSPGGSWDVVVTNPRTNPVSTPKAFTWVSTGANHSVPFHRIGHCLSALFVGLIGTLVARRFERGTRGPGAEG